MVISGVQKRKHEILRQKIDYSYWLSFATIKNVDLTVDPSGGVTPLAVTVIEDAGVLTLYLSGGDPGVEYHIDIHVDVSDGQKRDDAMKLRIMEVH